MTLCCSLVGGYQCLLPPPSLLFWSECSFLLYFLNLCEDNTAILLWPFVGPFLTVFFLLLPVSFISDFILLCFNLYLLFSVTHFPSSKFHWFSFSLGTCSYITALLKMNNCYLFALSSDPNPVFPPSVLFCSLGHILLFWRWKEKVTLKCWYAPIKLQDITFWKTY